MISGILIKIKSVLDDLTASEKKVAIYVLSNTEKALTHSIHQLARESGVSVASVSRFYKTLGLFDYKGFKISLAKDSIPSVSVIYQAITPKDSDQKIIRKVFAGHIRSLEETIRILNFKDLIKIASLILKAERVVFFGSGGSGIVAQEAALRFAHLDLQAEAFTDSYQILVQALRMDKNGVAFCISHSGRSMAIVEAAKLATQNGAVVIGISNYPKSALVRQSKYILCTSFSESRVKAVALSSQIDQLCLVDALYLLLAKHKKKVWNLEKLNEITENLLRSSSKK